MNDKSVQTRSSFDRLAMLGVTALGMAMCAPGVGKVAANGLWLTPQGVFGTTLGAAVLAMVAVRMLGMPLPYIASDRAATIAVVAIIALKMAVAAIAPLSA